MRSASPVLYVAPLRADVASMTSDDRVRALGPFTDLQPVSGGDIHQAFCGTTASGQRLFIKTHSNPPPGIFQAEADGLAALAAIDEQLCPKVVRVEAHALVLEWLDFAHQAPGRALGRALARVHRAPAEHFGGQKSNYLATLPQHQPPCSTWSELYRDHRLAPLIPHCPKPLRGALDRLLPRLDQLLALPDPPSWLHGDLWAGNAAVTTAGRAVLFDPAVSTGHREQDLAMTHLFGGFHADFYDAYEEVYPLTAGWEERVSLHQIYPLLAHVALFGAPYVARAQRAVSRWL